MTAPTRPTADPNRMMAGSAGWVDCGPGCSVAEHNHGAPSHGGTASGGGTGIVGDLKAELLVNADDQDGAQAHLGKTVDWYEKIQEDLARILDGTDWPDLDELRAELGAQVQKLEGLKGDLTRTADATREAAARR